MEALQDGKRLRGQPPFTHTCHVCEAKVSAKDMGAAGWRGRRLPGERLPVVYCPEHIPADLPPRRARARARAAVIARPWPGSRLFVHHRAGMRARMVFAFGLAEIADASGYTDETVRRAIWAKEFDPTDLVSLLGWVAASKPRRRDEPSGSRRWRRRNEETAAVDAFAVRGPAGDGRDDLVRRFHSIGFGAVQPASDDQRIEVHGDRLTVSSGARVLAFMEAHGLRALSRRKVREVVLLGATARARRPSSGKHRRLARLLATREPLTAAARP